MDPNAGIGRGRQFLEGIGASIDQTIGGLKQAGTSAADYFMRSNPALFGGDNLQETMAAQQAEEVERRRINDQMGGWGTAGQIAGTVGQILAPGGVAKLAARVP